MFLSALATVSLLAQPPQYGISRYAGAVCPANGTNILSWSLSQVYPSRVIAGSGNTYFITYQASVFSVAVNGTVARVAGTCSAGNSGDGGQALLAQLGSALDIAVDSNGNLLIADGSYNVVRKIAPSGIITTIAGTGIAGYSGDSGQAITAQITPNAIVADTHGGFYLLQKPNFVVRYVSSAGLIRTAAGTGVYGTPGDGGPATLATLYSPQSIALDPGGNLYISDLALASGAGNIRKVSTGGIISTFAGNGSTGGSGDGGPATSASLDQPGAITVDSFGNLYVVEIFLKKIRKVNTLGIISVFIDGSTLSRLAGPVWLSADVVGNLFITDTGSPNRVARADTQGNLATYAGNGFSGYSGDSGPATSAQLYAPSYLGVDGAGNLYIADSGRVRRVSVAGTITTLYTPATPDLLAAGKIAVDSSGNVYFPDTTHHRIAKVDNNGILSYPIGIGTAGFSGDGAGATVALLSSPSDIAVDGLDNIYINDQGNSRIRKVDSAGKISTLVAVLTTEPIGADLAGNFYYAKLSVLYKVTPAGVATAIAGTGAAGFSGDGGPATAAQFNDFNGVSHFAIAGDGAGNIFIGDLTGRIRRITAGGTIDTVAGYGVAGLTAPASTGDGGPATSALFNPNGLAIDRLGNLYLSDTQATSADGTNFVRKLTPLAGSPPIAPTLLSPSNGSAGIPLMPVLTWTASTGATSYDLYFSAGVTQNLALVATITGSNYQIGLPYSSPTRNLASFQIYSWKVVAKNASGSSAASTSSINTFTTGSGAAAALLSAAISHTGNFLQSQTGAPYSLTVSNLGTASTSGTVTVTASVSTGLTLVSMAGTGWTCTVGICSRADILAAGSAYPPISALVNVDAAAPASVSLSATVSGGGSAAVTTSDATTVTQGLVAGAHTPAVVSVSPATGFGSSQVYAFQFSDTSGFADLAVMNVLINSALDGRRGCYLAYVQASNTLFLVNDAGDAGGPYAGTLVMNGAGSMSNSQCVISGAGSSVAANGNILTLTLNISFSGTFGGNQVVYMAARDSVNNTGWRTMGVHGSSATPTTFPNAVGMSPASGTTANPTLSLTYQDATSAANLQTAWALINTAIDGRSACYVAYYRPGNQLYLYPDNGDGSQAMSMVLNGTNTLSNSQCTISAQGSSVAANGTQLVVNLNVAFKPAFTGPKGVWMATQTNGGAQTSAWQALGVWRVP